MDVNLVRVIILCEGCNANVQSNYIRLKNGLKKIRVHLLCGKSHRRNPSKLAAVKIQSSILKNAQYVKNLSSYVNNAERYCNIFNVYRYVFTKWSWVRWKRTHMFLYTLTNTKHSVDKKKYGSTNVSPPKTEFLLLRFRIEHNGCIKEFCVNGCKQSQNAFLSHNWHCNHIDDWCREIFIPHVHPMLPRDFTFYQKHMCSLNEHTRSNECLETILV